jgi:carboxypeptidase C (cathepsin A)
MSTLLQENGPCFVNEDSSSTYLNPWSWNNEVNMLYIDQQIQSGFSYDFLTNFTVDLSLGEITPADDVTDFPEQNSTFYVGTYASGSEEDTPTTTADSAPVFWYFVQAWLAEFPGYKTSNNKVSIWTEGHSGHFGPAFSAYIEQQNQKIRAGTLGSPAREINLDTFGIINGCIDSLIQIPSQASILYHNTYGLQYIDEDTYNYTIDSLNSEGGCLNQIKLCRSTGIDQDCRRAMNYCEYFTDTYVISEPFDYPDGQGESDFAHPYNDPFPVPYYQGYLARRDVQVALGVPVNFTNIANGVYETFDVTGDDARGGYVEDIGFLLDAGVKVAMVYGDRDYMCNWVGGELVSLAVNSSLSSGFHAAGYAPLQVNSTYVGGQTRQHGNFSFTRVYQAGQQVPAYQPEAAWQIFQRVMFNNDVPTGTKKVTNGFSTTGPADVFAIKNDKPPYPQPTCYVLDPQTCRPDDFDAVINGSVVVENYIIAGQLKPTGIKIDPTSTATSRPQSTTKKGAGSILRGSIWTCVLVTVAAALTC